MVNVALALVLWIVPAPPAVVVRPADWIAPAFTLFPERPRLGETLRAVVPAVVRDRPDSAANVAAVLDPGQPVQVRGTAVRDGVPWIETERGWVEAARMDRVASDLETDLPVGAEGITSGRVLPWSWRPTDLRAVPDSLKVPGYEDVPIRLRAGAIDAFAEMIAAAAADGVAIRIVSGFRGAERQRHLYAQAQDEDPRQRRSAAPGRSEHQLGTTADVTSPGFPALDVGFAASPAGRWIERRAAEFGIVATFSLERHRVRRTAHEPWHLRWVGRPPGDRW